MKKVYVITEVNYGEICWENDTIEYMEIFEDEDKALEFYKNKVLEEKNYHDNYVLDNECDIENIEVGDTIRFFYDRQENWDCYFEIKIEEVELRG